MDMNNACAGLYQLLSRNEINKHIVSESYSFAMPAKRQNFWKNTNRRKTVHAFICVMNAINMQAAV